MRKVFLIIAIIFIIIGIVFMILPLGSIGILPIGIATLFSLIAYLKSNTEQKKIPKWLLLISLLILLTIVVKNFIPNQVAKDSEFEQRKIESKKEDLKNLEDIE